MRELKELRELRELKDICFTPENFLMGRRDYCL